MSASANEFDFPDAAFSRIQVLLKQRSGIDIGPGKRMLIYGRLARRLRALGLSSFDNYLPLIEDAQAEESKHFLNACTTNVTELFREAHHFELLTKRAIPEALRRNGDRKIRIWSAGCSTGEEPYSIAISLAEAGLVHGYDVKILATDIDSDVLAHGRNGVYPADKVAKLQPSQRRYFQRGTGANRELARAKDELRNLIHFKELNLLGNWPMTRPFDVVFCRNVVIYFDTTTRERLVKRFAGQLSPGGYLFMGHSEALTGGSSNELESCGKTSYRKPDGS
ncbi:MAG: protein-glutamate O-methyltransferase CheR [Polyangiaceae bacterium]